MRIAEEDYLAPVLHSVHMRPHLSVLKTGSSVAMG